MLNPKFTSQFTKDLYAAICKEVDRLEKLTFSDQHSNANRQATMLKWKKALEEDSMFVNMELAKFPPDGPIRL